MKNDFRTTARVKKINLIFKQHYNVEADDPAADVSDILADIRHYCDKKGLDFGKLDRQAYRHYQEELNHENA